MDLQVSPVFLKNYNANKPHVVNCGGSRSGKSYSICQNLIIKHALRNRGLIIDIVRKTQAELRSTIMVDFFQILEGMDLYRTKDHNKTNLEYKLHGNLFRFLGLDRAQKKRGSKRNVLYINEANGLTLEDWVQLNVRTEAQIKGGKIVHQAQRYYDFNPSEYFWINEHILEKDSSKFDLIHSTYLDNYDFLGADQIAEIENLINIDDFYYKVYVLGILAVMKGKIYNNYTLIEPYEYDAIYADETFYGIDFGYENPTSLMEVKYASENVYERERYRATHKHDSDLLNWMNENNISQTDDIYADPENSAGINLLREAGYNIRLANKSVWDGIRFCQRLKKFICKSSTAYIREMNSYKFKQTADGNIIEAPVKINDHGADACRYAEFTHLAKRFMPYG